LDLSPTIAPLRPLAVYPLSLVGALAVCVGERDTESGSAAWSVAFSADRPGTYRLSTKSSRLQPEPTYRSTSLATYALYMLQLQFTSPFTDFLAFKPFPFFLSWEFCFHDNAIVNGGGEKIGTQVILHFETKKRKSETNLLHID